MPLYEYQCDQCDHRFEVIQKFSDAPVETCPKCGGPVKKLLSSPAIQFKGSGWYITDYAKKGSGERPKAEADKAAKPESKDSKGESASGTTSAEPSTSAPATDEHGPARTR